MRITGNELHVVKFDDPGHGWLAVKRRYCSGIPISPCSYQRGQTVYLEEDSDAPEWIRAMEQLGYRVFIDHRHTNRNSPIRSYASFVRSIQDSLNVVEPPNLMRTNLSDFVVCVHVGDAS